MSTPKAEGICEIGKYYLIPCVRAVETGPVLSFARKGMWIPILLPWHNDPDIGVTFHHYHLDFRFLPEWSYIRSGFGHTVSQPLYPKDSLFFEEKVVWKQRKCLRAMPQGYPVDRATWLPRLEAQYKAASLKDGRCPHRGVDVSGCQPDKDGMIVCPAHGLRWNAETGKLAPRWKGEDVCKLAARDSVV